MLAATDMGIIILFDAFSGALQHAYTGHNNTSRRPLQACITPDNKHVVTGSEDGEVFVYDIATEKVKKKLSGHVAPVRSVACSTKFEVLASACENIGLWSRGN
jgi:WD40 repeat protein